MDWIIPTTIIREGHLMYEALTSPVQEKLFAKVRNEFEPCEKHAFTVAEATKLPQLERLAPIFRWMCSGKEIDEVKEMVQIELKKISSDQINKDIFSLPKGISGDIFAEVIELHVPAPKLVTLMREDRKLLQAIVETIKENPGLQVFELFRLNSEDKEKLHLKILNLTWDKVEEEKDSHLQVLNLEKFGFGDSNEPLFFDAKSNFLAEVIRATNLKSFNWSGNRLLATEIQDALTDKEKLEVFCWTINKGDIFYADKFSKIIESAKNLKVLKINCIFPYEDLMEGITEALAGHKPELEMLWLQFRTISLTEEFAKTIEQIGSLRILVLEHYRATANEITDAPDIPRQKVAEGFTKAIVANENLEHLVLTMFDIQKNFFKEVFEKSNNLKFLHLQYCCVEVPCLEEEEIKTENLQIFSLECCKLKGKSMGTIKKIVNQSPSLWLLDLSGNPIGCEGAKVIADTLKEKNGLTMLGLADIFIENEGMQAIAEALRHPNAKNLSVLDLSSCNGYRNLEALSEVLKTHTNLQYLYLNYLTLTTSNKDIKSLSEALKSNTTLTSLGLVNSDINDAGATYLAEALRLNSNLVQLDLSGNKEITPQGALALWEGLKNNTTLTELDLGGYETEDIDGMIGIFEALKCERCRTEIIIPEGEANYQPPAKKPR